MINKKAGILLSSAFVLGLAACNANDNDRALDRTDDNRLNTMTRYDRDTGVFDDNGDRDNGRRLTGDRGRNGDRERRDRDNDDHNVFTDDLNISSLSTTLSSGQYPHTRAILIRDARYQFISGSRSNYYRTVPRYAQFPAQQRQTGSPGYEHNNEGQQNQNENQARAGQQEGSQAQLQPTAPQQQQQQAQAPKQQQAPAQQQQQPAQGISDFAQQVITLTNAERQKNGLKPLQADTQLSGVAQKKSEDMQKNNYFSHTSPTYGAPFDMMRDFGVTYRTAGENIAQGQQTPQQVVQAWMNSEGHRKNILNGQFTHIGVGFEKAGSHWTQMFIGK